MREERDGWGTSGKENHRALSPTAFVGSVVIAGPPVHGFHGVDTDDREELSDSVPPSDREDERFGAGNG